MLELKPLAEDIEAEQAPIAEQEGGKREVFEQIGTATCKWEIRQQVRLDSTTAEHQICTTYRQQPVRSSGFGNWPAEPSPRSFTSEASDRYYRTKTSHIFTLLIS